MAQQMLHRVALVAAILFIGMLCIAATATAEAECECKPVCDTVMNDVTCFCLNEDAPCSAPNSTCVEQRNLPGVLGPRHRCACLSNGEATIFTWPDCECNGWWREDDDSYTIQAVCEINECTHSCDEIDPANPPAGEVDMCDC